MPKDVATPDTDLLVVISFSARPYLVEVEIPGLQIEWLTPQARGGSNIFERARANPRAQLLVIYCDAATAFAAGLESARKISEFETDWRAESQVLFDYRLAHAERCVMGNISDLSRYDLSLIPSISSRLIQKLCDKLRKPSPVAQYLANELTIDRPGLVEFGQRLHASSMSFQMGLEGGAEPRQIASEYDVWRAHEGVLQELSNARADHNALSLEHEQLASDVKQKIELLTAENSRLAEAQNKHDLEKEISDLQVLQLEQEVSSLVQSAADAQHSFQITLEENASSYEAKLKALEQELKGEKMAVESAHHVTGTDEPSDVQNDRLKVELEIANLQIAQLQEELELSLVEWEKVANKHERRDIHAGTDVSPAQVRRLMAWGGHNNSPRPILSWLRPNSLQKKNAGLVVATTQIRESDWFDACWYEAQGEVKGIDAAEHYLRYGASQGRDPSAAFDTLGYLLANPDVVASGMNPLMHFLLYGEREGRSPRPLAGFGSEHVTAAGEGVIQ